MSTEKKELFEDWNMKPIIILPPDAVSAEDIKVLRENHLCVVVAKDPEAVKFLDPIPAVSSRSEMENAAIQLSRKLLAGQLVGENYRENITRLYVDILVKGTALDPQPNQQERERVIFDNAKDDEFRRLAREEAKAERTAAKAAASKDK